ncbi:hypothetical protein ACFX1Q_038488 [Malus domestica]
MTSSRLPAIRKIDHERRSNSGRLFRYGREACTLGRGSPMHIQGLEEVLDITFLLSKSEAAEDSFACLTISEPTISSTIIREELGAQLHVYYSSKARIDAIRNSKANFGDSCCNSNAQVLPSNARSHHHDALFRRIQTRDDKGVDPGGCKVF